MRANIDITGDNDNIVSVVNDTVQHFEELAEYMESLGKKGFDLSSQEKAVEQLQKYLDALTASLQQQGEQLLAYKEEMKEALSAGDTARVKAIGDAMNNLAESMQEVSLEAGRAQEVLSKLGADAKDGGDKIQESGKDASVAAQFWGTFKSSLLKGLSITALATAAASALKKLTQDFLGMTQRVSDAWGRETAGWKNAYESFVASIGSGKGWNEMINGMLKSYTVGKQVYDLLDELFEINNSIAVKESEYSAEIEKNRQIMMDSTASYQERIAAADAIIEKETVLGKLKQDAADKELKAQKELLQARTGLEDTELKDFIHDYNDNEQLIDDAQAYIDELKELQKEVDNWQAASITADVDGVASDMIENNLAEAQNKLNEFMATTDETVLKWAETIEKYNQGSDQLVTNYVNAVVKANNVAKETSQATRRAENTKKSVQRQAAQEKYQSDIADIDAATKAEEMALKRRYADGEMREREYQEQMSAIRRDGLEKRIQLEEKYAAKTGGKEKRKHQTAIVNAQAQLADLDVSDTERAYSKELDAINKALKQREILIKKQYTSGEASEEEYQREMRAIQKDGLTQRLELLKKYNKDSEEAELSVVNYDVDKADKAQQDRLQYLESYGDMREKELAITEKYNSLIAKAQNEYEKKLLERQQQDELDDLRKSYSATYALIFADAGNLSDTYLVEAIGATQKEIEKAKKDGNIQALSELYGHLQEQLSEQGSRKGMFEGLISGFQDLEKAREALDKAYAVDDAQEQENQLSAIAAALAQIKEKAAEAEGWMSAISDTLRSFDIKGLNAVADLFDGLKGSVSDILTIFSQDGLKITKSMKQGAVAGALDATLSLITLIGDSVAKNREAQKEWNRTLEQSAHNLAKLELDKLDYKQSNIFGIESPYQKAIDGATQYGKAIEELQGRVDKLNAGQVQVGTKKALDWKAIGQGFAKGAGAGAGIGGIVGGAAGGVFAPIGAALGAAIGGVVGAAAGAFATKTEPIFASLSSKYGQLVMEDYSLNPQLLADYDKLDEDTKQLIDNWEEIKEKAQEAEEQMRENFADLAGDVGTQLSDALVNAFKNGNLYDAIEDFHTTMTRTIESILSQLVFSNVFGDLFDTLEKNMMDSFGVGGDQDITDDLREFEKRYPDLMSAYGDAMTAVQESMKALGYDVFSDSAVREEGSVGSFKGMSQATGTALEGRFTAVQIATEMIAERMITNLALMTAMNEYMAGSNTTLSEIRDAHIREVGYLEDIARQTRPISTLIGMGDDLKTIANKL